MYAQHIFTVCGIGSLCYRVIIPLTHKGAMRGEAAITGWNWQLEVQVFCSAPGPELRVELGSVRHYSDLQVGLSHEDVLI